MRMSNRSKVMMVVGIFGLTPALAHATVFTDVPEAAGMLEVFRLPIPAGGTSFNSSAIPYTVDNSDLITPLSFTRVGYYLELAGSGVASRPNGFVYASFDVAGFQTDVNKLGVPANNVFNGTGGFFSNANVTNLNVVSNVPGIVNGTGFTDGKVNFWPSNYGTGANGVFDHDDDGFNGGSGHGSMQIHRTAPYQTLIGYSDWGGNNAAAPAVELGIGTNTGTGHPDWTFSDSGSTYTVRNMSVVVNGTLLPPPVAAAPPAPPALVALCPDLAGYQLVYQEALAGSGNLNAGAVAYDVDNTGLVGNGSFKRVAYLLQLSGATDGSPNGFVCVSFDTAGVTTAANKLGIPVDAADIFYRQLVNNLSVDSNVAGVVNGDFAQGNIEFWPTNYGPENTLPIAGASGSTFDFGDGGSGANGGGFGSMQIHNFLQGQTVMAFNAWGTGGTFNLGIGNNPSGQPDWTFRNNGLNYTTRNLFVLIQPNAVLPEPASAGLIGLAGLTLGMRRRRQA